MSCTGSWDKVEKVVGHQDRGFWSFWKVLHIYPFLLKRQVYCRSYSPRCGSWMENLVTFCPMGNFQMLFSHSMLTFRQFSWNLHVVMRHMTNWVSTSMLTCSSALRPWLTLCLATHIDMELGFSPIEIELVPVVGLRVTIVEAGVGYLLTACLWQTFFLILWV